jgi:hypothetical protein
VDESAASYHAASPAIRRGSKPLAVGLKSLGFMPMIVTLQW